MKLLKTTGLLIFPLLLFGFTFARTGTLYPPSMTDLGGHRYICYSGMCHPVTSYNCSGDICTSRTAYEGPCLTRPPVPFTGHGQPTITEQITYTQNGLNQYYRQTNQKQVNYHENRQPEEGNILTPIKTEIEMAVERMHDEGLTIYDNATDFTPDKFVTRQEAAKFLSMFALSLGQTENSKADCKFSDIGFAEPNLVPYLLSACRLGIMKGYNHLIDPLGGVKTDAGETMFIRIIVGQLPENGTHYWDNYHQKGYEMGLFAQRFRKYSLQRGNFAIYMYEYMFPQYRNNQNDANGS